MYSKIMKLSENLGVPAFFLLRVILGIIFLRTGYGKWMHLENTIQYFRSLHIPAPQIQAPFVATVECVGGLFIILGIYARPAALLLSGTMVVAIITAIWPNEPNKYEVLKSVEVM
jgi:putative oxidoreductase